LAIEDNEIYIRYLFAKNLKKFREDIHMSQMELAAITDLSHNFINDIEHEKKWPSAGTFAKLVKVFKTEPHCFFLPELKLNIKDTDIFKAELANSIALAVNEKIDRHFIDTYENEKEQNKPGEE